MISLFEPLPGYDPGTYGLRNRIPAEINANSHESSIAPTSPHVDPHAPPRILGREPDQVALRLLEAGADWLNRRDPVQLRRALLALLSALDE